MLEPDQLELHPRDAGSSRRASRSVNSSSGRRTFSSSVIEPNSAPRLVHDADLAQDRAFAPSPSAVTMSSPSMSTCPAMRLVEADHVLEQRALAAARAAEDDEHLAAAHVEVELVEQDEVVVAGGQVLDADDRLAAGAAGAAISCAQMSRKK